MRIEDLLDRATAASHGGRREEARDLLVDVLAVDPGNLEAWLRLAELAASAERAALYYQRATEIDPRSLRAQKGLSEALAILGPAQEPERVSHAASFEELATKEESFARPRDARSTIPAAPLDSPIFVDNEAAPFALDLGRASGVRRGGTGQPGDRESGLVNKEHPIVETGG